MKRLLSLLLSVIPMAMAFGSAFGAPVFATDTVTTASPPASLSAESAILMEAEDRTVLYEKNAYTEMGIASTTKIMTALIAAETLDPDTVLTVPREAVGVEGSSVYLVEGEKLTARELLYALMLASANDAATALALSISESVEQFSARMNERASSLGLEHTHFENPHGLAVDGHYTTAYDLALLSAAALENPMLREIAATKKMSIPFDGTPNARYLLNHNRMLTRYEGAIGLKTGFTKKTGRCLVSAAERDGMTLISVTLNAPDDWNDHTAMLDYGFSAYERLTLFESGGFSYALPLVGGKEAYATLVNTQPVTMLLPKDHETPVLTVEILHRFEYAPVKKDTVEGKLICVCGDKRAESPLTVKTDVPALVQPRRSLWKFVADTLGSWFSAFSQIFQAME